MKQIILTTIFSLLLPAISSASTECAGRTADGTLVRVAIATKGATAKAAEGSVSFKDSSNTYGYKFSPENITQFFESDESATGSAIFGLVAYAEKENPVLARYVGVNFVDMDLGTIIDGGEAKAQTGNYLRVWKGPGHAASDQIQLTEVACAVWMDL